MRDILSNRLASVECTKPSMLTFIFSENKENNMAMAYGGLKLRNVFSIFVGLVFCAQFYGQGNALATDEMPFPKIAFDAMEKDFGSIAEGDEKAFEFVVTNTGESELVVSHLRSLCDCVEVMMDETLIRPGKSSRLRGVFRSEGRWGDQEKVILLSSNASNAPEAELKIHLSVASGIRVTPRSFSFGEIARNRFSTKKIKIEARLEKELKIENMQVLSADNVTASILRRKVSPIELPSRKKGYLSEIDIILKAENDSAGEFSGQLSIETDLARNPHLQILFSGEKTGALEVAPAVVQFKNVLPGQTVRGVTTVKSLNHSPFRVTSLNAGRLPINLGKRTDKALEEQRITLVFTAPENPRRFYRGYVYLMTDHPTQKRIKVAVNAVTLSKVP
jgi:hypothetical protein